MKSITIHNLDDSTAREIERIARKEGKSLNKVIKELLHKVLNIALEEQRKKELLEKMCGMWSEEEYQEFMKATEDTRQVDLESWK